jgi:hypothetical protein
VRTRRSGWAAIAATVLATMGTVAVPVAAGAGAPGRAPGREAATDVQAAAVPSPTVTGPITGGTRGFALPTTPVDLAADEFTEAEYFFSGTAASYGVARPLTNDGRWSTVRGSPTAAFTSRLLVRRPTPAKFNGTVLVEWLNVTGGVDAGPDWTLLQDLILRDGYAWVGVSAQAVGVNGFPAGNLLGNASALKNWDPVRYGPLVHPGDSWSYDIYSQAAQALLTPVGADPLAGLSERGIQRLVAIGQSQSAARLVTYVNAVQPFEQLFDAFLIHSRSGAGSMLAQDPLAPIPVPAPTTIRDDLGVPVLVFEAEGDALGHFPARQPDTATYRLWEVAGSAHADEFSIARATTDGLRSATGPNEILGPCGTRYNTLLTRDVLAAAVVGLDRWLRTGSPPPSAPRIDITAGDPNVIERDADGNATGGIRTPQLDVPIATLSGIPGPGSVFCRLFGSTTPFSAQTLAARYPTRATYASAFAAATNRAVLAGHLLAVDGERQKRQSVDDVFAFGDASSFGSTGTVDLNARLVGIAATPSGHGYWEVTEDGGIFSFGDASFHGSTGAIRLNQPIVGMAADPLGRGYWTVAADGGVFAFGVPFFGSTGGVRLNQPIVAMAATQTGAGYWLVARDGGIFAFGDAAFSGSTGAVTLSQPIVGLAPDPDGTGYWLVARDGGVFAFAAPYHGPPFLQPALDDVAVGLAPTPDAGYWIVWRGGRVVPIGDAPTVGDAASNGRDIVGVAPTPTGDGFWLAVAAPV